MDNELVLAKALKVFITLRMEMVNDKLGDVGPFDTSFDCELENSFNEGMYKAYQDVLEVIPDMIKDYVSG